MPDTAKISISLPRDTLEACERERASSGETRSQFFRRAVETLLAERRRRAAVGRYVEGYVAEPETEYEVDASDALAGTVLSGEPWE